jgi:hypothetical protein
MNIEVAIGLANLNEVQVVEWVEGEKYVLEAFTYVRESEEDCHIAWHLAMEYMGENIEHSNVHQID